MRKVQDNDISLSEHLTSGPTLVRNTVWNLAGRMVPALVSVVSAPLLIRGLGTTRFGILSILWVLIGYFSLFDFGLGRALTQLVAERFGADKAHEVPALVWTAQFLMLALGIAGMLVVCLVSPWLVYSLLKIPADLEAETLTAFYLLAICLPVVISATGLRGVLEAQQQFRFVNLIRTPMGVLMLVGPVLVLPFSNSLVAAATVLVLSRLAGWLAFGVACLYTMPGLRRGFRVQRAMIKPLLRSGGWMSVTNIVSPLMVTLDRFLIGALLSVAAVAYYTTPFEMVTKLFYIPNALVSVLFPAFSTGLAQDSERAALLFERGLSYVFILLFPIILLLIAFSREILAVWLGAEFAQNSAPVLRWLAVGVLLNSVAQVPLAFVQGAGRPDLTAKLHLIELPLYLVGVWLALNAYGIVGAAMVWFLRVAVDMVFLSSVTRWFVPSRTSAIRRTACKTLPFLVTLALPTMLSGAVARGLLVLVVLVAFALVTWCWLLGGDERVFIVQRIRAGLSRFGSFFLC